MDILSCHHRNILFYTCSAHYQEYSIVYSLLWSNIYHLHTFIISRFARLTKCIIMYFYVICEYYRTHKYGGVLGYPNQDTKWEIAPRKYRKYSLNSFPPIFSYYFFTLLILNWESKIITKSQIYFRITSYI